MYDFWAGTGDSLQRFLDLNSKYGSQIQPAVVARDSADDEETWLDPAFGVDIDRAGLLHLERNGNTGILKIQGSLVNGHQWWHAYVVGELTSYAALKDAVQILKADASISRVLIQVDSGGGAVAGVDSAARALKSLEATKNVTVHSETGAGSAGYWLAASAGKLFASPMATMGNIGTMVLLTDSSEAYAKAGVKFHLIKAGAEKGYGLPVTEFTAEELASIQSFVDKSNNFFLTHVSRSRNLMVSDATTWADAKIFFAGEAKAVGLIDGVATLEEVIGNMFASTTTGDNQMLISAEKLALIAAGAAPESVLTQAELAYYLDTAAKDVEPVEPEAVPEPVEPLAADPAPVEPTAEDVSLAIQLGRAEAKLEAVEAKLVTATETNEAMATQMSSLLVVAQAAVGNLQVALQKPKEVKSSAPDLLAQFNDLQTEMADRFPVGRKSSATSSTQALEVKAKVPHPLRPQ